VSKDADRIAELESENALLKRELLLIRQPWRRHLYATDEESRRLLSLVRTAHRDLAPSDIDTDRFFSTFRVAFAFVGTLRRTEAPNTSVYFNHWSDLGRSWSAANNAYAGADILPVHVHYAALAWGDVAWQAADSINGVLPALALNEYSGRAADQRFRSILAATGRLLPPTPPREARMAPRRSDILIVGGNRAVGAGHVY
jgi:hypothetical protein